jgi:hypothetical protein
MKLKIYGTSPSGEKIELTNTPQETKVIIPPKIAYAQAWKDLRNKFIDQLTVKPEGYLYAEDLKKAMDEMLIDYKI